MREDENVMHEGQIEVALSALASAIAVQFSQYADYSVERIESAGTVVAPFRVGGDMVARLPLVPTDTDDARDSVRMQQDYAVLLARHLRIAVPRPIGQGRPFPSYPGVWSLWTWLPGRSLDRLAVAHDCVLAENLAATLRTIHGLPTQGRSWNGEGRGGRPLADTAWVRKSIDRASHLVDPDRATAVWERALEAPPHDGPASRIHGDPSPGNFLASNGRLTGMIDVAHPTFGDPGADLQPAWVLLEEPARSVFVAAMGLDTAAQERGRGWAFEMAIGGAHYYEHSNPVFFRQAMTTLHRLLDD